MIVVTAPTGLVGHQVLENLLDSDEPVRVIARGPNRLAAGLLLTKEMLCRPGLRTLDSRPLSVASLPSARWQRC
jgi:uncharacterized protein YbjT (DUF2867 family)